MTEETLPIRPEDIAPMDHIAADLIGLRILFVNVFALSHADGSWTLIDAGIPGSGSRIRSWAHEHFGDRAPTSIILTHGHFDHAGAAHDLADHWNVPVYAHALEFPFLNGTEKYPPPDPSVGGGLMAIMSPLYPRGPFNLGDRLRALPENEEGSVPDLPGWRALHTPGHTRGHVSFFRESDRTLLVGDAFCTVKAESMLAIATQRPELHGPPSYYTPDWDSTKASVEKLSALNATVLAPGHGQAMSGADLPQLVSHLAAHFDQIARPHHGKYAEKDKEHKPAA